MDSNKNNKPKKKKKDRGRIIIILLALLLILAGVIIAAYPYIIQWVFNNRQQDLMDMWSQKKDGGLANTYDIIVGRTPPDDNNDDIMGNDDIFEEDIDAFFDYDYAYNNMIGILKIPDINMRSPILVGDTQKNLNVGVCEVKQSVRAGQPGNYILAGHYSRVYGRHFNRIFEIRVGSPENHGTSVFVETAEETYEYIIYERLQVKADDTWAVPINITEELRKQKEAEKIPEDCASIITLITCDYSFGEPYGRVIVKGWLNDNKNDNK